VSDASNPGEAGAEVRAVPEGYHAVTPWIISRDTAGLIEFVKRSFGAEEIARVQDENGAIGHAEFRTPLASSACTSRTPTRCTGGHWRLERPR
jgi:hypothetical protein